MRILIAPDKFKGSLSAKEAAQAIEAGLLKFNPGLETVIHPMADGGEGSVEVLAGILKLKPRSVVVNDPLGRAIRASYFTSKNEAFIEMASASGMALLNPEEQNCLYTSSGGTGQLILDAYRNGFRKISLFVGGSATCDGGIGMAGTLGYRFLDDLGQPVKTVGGELHRICKMDSTSSKIDLKELHLKVLCDVSNPLLGQNGAARVYAPQKGASQDQVETLENGMENFSKVLLNFTNKDYSKIPGTGAAGGLPFGAMALLGASLIPGIQTIIELTGLEEKVKKSDIIITGEGKMDGQTLQGKVVSGVCTLAERHKKKVASLCGKNSLSVEQLNSLGLCYVLEIMKEGMSESVAFEKAWELLSERAFELAKVVVH